MLGRKIADPHGTEGPPGEVSGLGYLNTETVFSKQKKLTRVKGHCDFFGCSFSGYEIHMGRTQIYEKCTLLNVRALLNNEKYQEGCISEDQRIMGTYVHGIFDDTDFLKHFLHWVNAEKALKIPGEDLKMNCIDKELDKLVEHIETYVDVEKFFRILGKGV